MGQSRHRAASRQRPVIRRDDPIRLHGAATRPATGRLVRQIRRLRPQVIVTFDANGGYGHRDHIAIHHLTTAAFHQSGDATAYPEHRAAGLEPYTPQKLYYIAFPRATMQWLLDQARREQLDLQPFGAVATIPVQEMGTTDERVTTTLPLDDTLYAVREAAVRAHRTRRNPNGPWARVAPEVLRAVWGTQYFVRAVPPSGLREGREHDLFAGVV